MGAGGKDVGFALHEISDPLMAEHSPVVTQKREDDGAILPRVADARRAPVIVDEDEMREFGDAVGHGAGASEGRPTSMP